MGVPQKSFNILSINPFDLTYEEESYDSGFPQYESKIFDNKKNQIYEIVTDTFNDNADFISDEDIESLTSQIRELTEVSSNNSIDVISIARKLGFKIVKTSFNNENISGKIEINDKEKIISVNKNESSLRQRFTIAHELGHAILNNEKNKIDYRKYDRGYNKAEFQANLFASSLLMPKESVLKIWASSYSLKLLSKFFEDSESAVSIRLINLGLLS